MGHASGWRGVLETITTIAVLVFCLVATWKLLRQRVDPGAGPLAVPSRPVESGEAAVPIPSLPVSLEGAAIKGNASAPIALIEFSDFQCPYCAAFARETLPQLEAMYVGSGKVLVAFRHLPLPTIHPFSRAAAEAAVCNRQSREGEQRYRLRR